MSPQQRREVAARGGRASGRRRSGSAEGGRWQQSDHMYGQRDFPRPWEQQREYERRPYRDYGMGYEPGFRGHPSYSDWRQQEYEAGAWRRRQSDPREHRQGGYYPDPRHQEYGPQHHDYGYGPRGRYEHESEHLPGGYAPPRAREDYGEHYGPRDRGSWQPKPRGQERHSRGRQQRSRSRR